MEYSHLWDLKEGKLIKKLLNHQSSIEAVLNIYYSLEPRKAVFKIYSFVRL